MFRTITKPLAVHTARQRRIYDFLAGLQSGVLSSVCLDGKPHATVVYYFIDPQSFRVFFLTKKGTQKYDNLLHDNRVVFVVYDEKKQKVAQVFGEAQEITDSYAINEVASRIYAQNAKIHKHSPLPIARLQAGEYTAFFISPTQIHIASFSTPQSGDYEHMFESIESFDLNPVAEI